MLPCPIFDVHRWVEADSLFSMKGTDAITEGESAEMDRPLSRSELEHLVRSGLVPQEHADRAFAAFRDAVDWVSWLRL